MPVSRKDIVDALKAEVEQAERTIEQCRAGIKRAQQTKARCNVALRAFEGVADTGMAVADGGPDMGGDRVVDTPTKPKRRRGIGLDAINRAKARVKRFEHPFNTAALAKEMDCHPVQARVAVRQLQEEGWLELAERRANTQGGNLYRYVPAKPDPKSHPRHDHPRATNLNGGRGEAVAGTGKGLRATDHDINEIIRKLRSDHWVITKSGSDHYIASRGSRQVRFSGSPPGQTAINKIKSDLRAAGARM